MIILKGKVDCCGCTACQAVCPVSCISMEIDPEGFLYPKTDTSNCINCNACNRVCPVINKQKGNIPYESSDFYAARIHDMDILSKSSSGGIFSHLASYWINNGGVVYGAAWNQNSIEHIEASTLGELNALRGSKYAQSNLTDCFKRIRELLSLGKKVLFSGTPCQVDGLKRFLKKSQPLLLTIEVACHGVPSPLVLEKYLKELCDKYSSTVSLDFRDKSHGWLHYNVKAKNSYGGVLFCENHNDNIFMRGFLHELYSRPSCHECPSKAGTSGADFTLCDFWGIEDVVDDFDYEQGASLMIANTDLAKQIVTQVLPDIALQKVLPCDAMEHNGSLLHSDSSHPERAYFFNKLSSTNDVIHLINMCLSLRFSTKLRLRANAYLKRIKAWK